MNLKNQNIEMMEKVAEGGQGEVYRARVDKNNYALKMYFESAATPEQRSIILHLLSKGLPASAIANNFVLPIALVEDESSRRFGYLMDWVDPTRFVSLAKVKSGEIPHPGYGIIAEICRKLAESYRLMHGEGYCYRDISEANFFMDLKTAEIRIIDNDNCMVDNVHVGSIEGTAGFMAPEVQRGEALPSTVTDQHSLAVLLFILWHWHHPLHGLKESNISCYDLPAQDLLYGYKPVFIFDPHDRSNALPNEAGYRAVPVHWNVLPAFMRRLFTQAFTKGLHEPAARVTDLEWIHSFSRLKDLLHICPDCHAENFYDPEETSRQLCWNRQCLLQFPMKLALKNNPENSLLVRPGKKLTTSLLGRKSSIQIIGQIEEYPDDKTLCLLRNKTATTWVAKSGNDSIAIPKNKGIVLYPGIHLQIENSDLIVNY